MDQRLAAIIAGVIALLMSSLCCLTALGAGIYSLASRSSENATVRTVSDPVGGEVSGSLGRAATQLALGQRTSNYGSATITAPVSHAPVDIVSGVTATSAVPFGSLGMVAVNSGTCTGHGTSAPDYIVDVPGPLASLAFVVSGQGDTTLVVHHNGRIWCSDDDGEGLNLLVRIRAVEAGQYDVWVGSYSATQNFDTTLTLTP